MYMYGYFYFIPRFNSFLPEKIIRKGKEFVEDEDPRPKTEVLEGGNRDTENDKDKTKNKDIDREKVKVRKKEPKAQSVEQNRRRARRNSSTPKHQTLKQDRIRPHASFFMYKLCVALFYSQFGFIVYLFK